MLNRQCFPPERAQWSQHNAHQFRPDYKLSYLLFYSNRLKGVDLLGKLHSGLWPHCCRTIWYSSKLSVDDFLDLEVGIPYVPREPMQNYTSKTFEYKNSDNSFSQVLQINYFFFYKKSVAICKWFCMSTKFSPIEWDCLEKKSRETF